MSTHQHNVLGSISTEAYLVSPTATNNPISSFSSPAGQALAREILEPLVGFDPHDYQIEGTCKVLDGTDLVSIIPTAGGKTGFFFMPVLLRKHIRTDTRIAPELRENIRDDGVMVVVLPTIAVEDEMVRGELFSTHCLY
jgi:hypothetical protein